MLRGVSFRGVRGAPWRCGVFMSYVGRGVVGRPFDMVRIISTLRLESKIRRPLQARLYSQTGLKSLEVVLGDVESSYDKVNNEMTEIVRRFKENSDNLFEIADRVFLMVSNYVKQSDNIERCRMLVSRMVELLAPYNFSVYKRSLLLLPDDASLSTGAMIQVLRSNPQRVETSWELFLDLLGAGKVDSLCWEQSGEELFSVLIDQILCESKAEEEAEKMRIASKIVFLMGNFSFRIEDVGLAAKIEQIFAESNILSVLLMTWPQFKVDVNRPVSLESLQDMVNVQKILLDSANNTHSLDQLETLRLVARYLRNPHDILPEKVKIINNHLKNYGNYLLQNRFNVSFAPLTDEQTKQFVHTLLDGIAQNNQLSKLDPEILTLVGTDLDDMETALLLFHKLLSDPHRDHDRLRLSMLRIFTFKCLKEQKLVPWASLAETMIPESLSRLANNIDVLINNTDCSDVSLKANFFLSKELDISVQALHLLILLHGETDFDKSIDLFNTNIPLLQKFVNHKPTENTLLTTNLVDALIKVALLRKERELAYVIYDKSLENLLLTSELDKRELKQNFKEFGQELAFRDYVLDSIKKNHMD